MRTSIFGRTDPRVMGIAGRALLQAALAARQGVLPVAATLLMATGTYAVAGPIVEACPAPMAPRRAVPHDGVCVPPESVRRVAAENARAALLWVSGPFGPKTCASDFVWRAATPDDYTCVTPDIRSLVSGEQANPQLAPGS